MSIIIEEQFHPYIDSTGKEYYIPAVLQEKLGDEINYDNYRESKFDDFWNILLVNKENNSELYPSALINFLNNLNAKENFQNYILDIYNIQRNSLNEDDYYFFVKFIDVLTEKLSISADNIKDDFLALFITNTEDLDDSIREPYFSVNEIKDFTKQETNGEYRTTYNFKYHELSFQKKNIYKSIYKVSITGPFNTMFLINRQPSLFYIDEYNQSLFNCKINIDTEGLLPIEYITFPKNPSPAIGATTIAEMDYAKKNDAVVTVTIFYDSD